MPIPDPVIAKTPTTIDAGRAPVYAALVAIAGAGFLFAVLWFDLMHDMQALGRSAGLLPDAALDSIAGYYHRVTTASWPMGALVALVMFAVVTATATQLMRGWLPPFFGIVALALCSVPIALALLRVLPNAARLGSRSDSLDVQSDLARAILFDHTVCFAGMSIFLALQIAYWGHFLSLRPTASADGSP